MEVYNQLGSSICLFDARSGVLCSKCESKLESGGITRDDVKAVVRLAGDSGARVNIEKAVKNAKAVRNIELLVEFENR